MKLLPPLDGVRRVVQDAIARVRESRFLHDRFSVLLLGSAIMINLLGLAWLLLNVHATDVPVPVRYSNLLSGFDQTGPWFFPFLVLGFAMMVTITNGLFAYHSFARSRLASFFLLVAADVVGVFGIIIASAFGAVR